MEIRSKLCILCRGAKKLCGYAYCPLTIDFFRRYRLKALTSSKTVFGSTPPSIYVGYSMYPCVWVSLGTPPILGDTSIYDLPEKWVSISIDDVLLYRLSIVYGGKRVRVNDVEDSYVLKLHEVVLSLRPIDVELKLLKTPHLRPSLTDIEPPMGPRAPIEELSIYSSSSSHRVVEKVYSDTDLSAVKAVVELYRHSIPVSYIQKLLSVGALGKKDRRKLVPTRWAITAVDDILSRYLVRKIKEFPVIDSIYVFIRKIHRNTFIAILFPKIWSFEWLEAWFPGSVWNRWGKEVVVEGDYELYGGRTTYAKIGGCYYASRLAVAEYLYSIGRQATAVLLREIYGGFDIPIGVWFVRENVRAMLRSKPIRIDNEKELMEILDKYTVLGSKQWIEKSRILSNYFSRKLSEFL